MFLLFAIGYTRSRLREIITSTPYVIFLSSQFVPDTGPGRRMKYDEVAD